ncbi:hypothetical protein OH708_08350 [Pseudomonas capsici]|uniref:hypothetical protein n=1 Tax=Pseudomonas capsici TaxID=2810614 RepID=UPI0021F210A5|nr:hypothetical protein [Pseudomonas capsici]MCV4287913.1 hypothetical protein [Pseudomonas capsici]
MNAALKLALAQQAHDNLLPDDADDSAERQWVENSAEQLMLGADVRFQRFGKKPQGVTLERFHVALDELLMARTGRDGASNSVLGKMVHAVEVGDLGSAREALSEALELPQGVRRAFIEQAEGLLRPLARDGVFAQQEDSL